MLFVWWKGVHVKTVSSDIGVWNTPPAFPLGGGGSPHPWYTNRLFQSSVKSWLKIAHVTARNFNHWLRHRNSNPGSLVLLFFQCFFFFSMKGIPRNAGGQEKVCENYLIVTNFPAQLSEYSLELIFFRVGSSCLRIWDEFEKKKWRFLPIVLSSRAKEKKRRSTIWEIFVNRSPPKMVLHPPLTWVPDLRCWKKFFVILANVGQYYHAFVTLSREW